MKEGGKRCRKTGNSEGGRKGKSQEGREGDRRKVSNDKWIDKWIKCKKTEYQWKEEMKK